MNRYQINLIFIMLFALFFIACTEKSSPVITDDSTPLPVSLRTNILAGYYSTLENFNDTLKIRNDSTGVLTWFLASDQPWIILSDYTGQNNKDVIIKFDTSYFDFQAGFHGNVYLNSNAGSKEFSIMLEYVKPSTHILYSYDFGYEVVTAGQHAGDVFYIDQKGWTERVKVISNEDWVLQAANYLTPANYDSLISAFAEIDFFNLPRSVPVSGPFYWPCEKAIIMYKNPESNIFKDVYVLFSQSGGYPTGFLEFHGTVKSICYTIQ